MSVEGERPDIEPNEHAGEADEKRVDVETRLSRAKAGIDAILTYNRVTLEAFVDRVEPAAGGSVTVVPGLRLAVLPT